MTADELRLMQVEPTAPDTLVTLANWQTGPWNRWSFQHVSELIPTARISRGQCPVWELGAEPANLDGLNFEASVGRTTVAAHLERSYTDGFLVLHRGRIVTEQYFNGMTRETRHLLQSVSKSITGSLAGVLVGDGRLHPEAALTEYVAELHGTSFESATVRQLLDMATGTRFTEDYEDPEADVNQYETASGWRPSSNGRDEQSLLGYILGLENHRAHGEVFEYRSILTDLLGVVLERAAHRRFAELLSDLVWARLGAEDDAEVTVDLGGTALADGGISTTLRDLARFGQMHLQGGSADGRQVVPASWVNDIRYADEQCRRTFSASEEAEKLAICEPSALVCYPRGHYRNQWWVPDPLVGVLLGSGIYGQTLYVNMFANVVIAKVSSQPLAFDRELAADVLRACAAICAALVTLP
jgi:CubicO group peptidase (beta-lactamase class C family)